MRRLLVLPLLTFAACATETTTTTIPCMTPAANYKIEFKPANGNCPEALVKEWIEGNTQTSAKVSEACFTKSLSAADSVTDNATGVVCNIAISGSKFGTQAEYGGTTSLAVTCDDGFSCQHSFTVIYTKQ